MLAILSLMVVIVISLTVVKVATIALVLTGLSQSLARFQARSAFTGAGFTTNESEKVVGHPVRRRIIMTLMLLGNAGLVTAVSSLMLSFIQKSENPLLNTPGKVLLIVAGVTAIWLLSSSQWVNAVMTRWIGWALRKYTKLEAIDYAGLLHVTGDYIVAEMKVNEQDWLSEKPLKQLRLAEEGLLILDVERPGGVYVGTPRGSIQLRPGDIAIIYGSRENVSKIDQRSKGSTGNWEHLKGVEKQMNERNQQEAEEQALYENETGPDLSEPVSKS